MSMELNKGVFAQLGPMYDQLLSMTPNQIMTSGAPEFLKIAAMQQQGRAREALSAPMPPSSTVAQDVVQRAVAPTGIGALPTSAPASSPPALAAAPSMDQGVTSLETSPDMFNERYYADGGIVGFENGGKIGSGPVTMYGEGYKPNIRKFIDWTSDIEEIVPVRTNRGTVLTVRKKADVDKEILSGVKDPVSSQEKEATPIAPELSVEEARKAFGYTAPTSGKEPSVTSYPNKIVGEELPPEEPPTSGDYFTTIMGQLDAGIPSTTEGIASLGAAPSRRPLKFAPEEKALSYEEAIAMKQGALKAAGVDREAEKARRQGMLTEKSAEYEERKRRAPWESLIEAGLNIAAGTSPNMLENIAKGAQQGFASYKEVAKELKADKDLLDELESRNAEAEYAERLGDAEYADRLVQENSARRREAAANKVEQINSYNTEMYKVEAQRHENQINRLHEANLTNSKLRAEAVIRASQLAQELTIAREKIAADLQVATLGMESSTIKSLFSNIGKGSMTEKQYFDAIEEIMQDNSITMEINEWRKQHSDATPAQIEGYRLTLAKDKLRAIMSTKSQMSVTDNNLKDIMSFINKYSSGVSGLSLEKVED